MSDTKYTSGIELLIGSYYELNYKKERRSFLYQGQRDTGGRAHVFVNNKALYCIEPGALSSLNIIPIKATL